MTQRVFFRGAALAASLVVALPLVACSTSGAGQSGQDAGGKTIKVLVSSGHQQFKPVWDKLPEFTAQTGIKVQLDQVATTDIEGAFQRDVTVGACTYDNVELLDGALAGAAPKMADLSTYLTKSGSSAQALFDAQVGWTKGAMEFDGKVAYYPFYSGSKGIAYREDLFTDAKNKTDFKAEFGYDIPTPPTTPAQIVDLAKFFTGRGTQYGIVFSGQGDSGETTLADVIFRHGVNGYQSDDDNAMWGPSNPANQAKVVESATWLTDLIKNGYAPKSVTAMATGEATSFYTDGNAAMIYDHIYLPWAQFSAQDVVSKIGESGSFAPPSFVEGAGGITFYWGRGIPECSKNKDASWTFMQWVMSEENQKLALTEGQGVYVPTDKNLLAWSVEQGKVPQGVADAVSTNQPYKVTTATGRMRQKVNLPLVDRLYQGNLTPEQYAKDSGEAIQKEAVDSGLVK
ncbi:ABC transporter substrate-binding protein [Asanoa iriomotensis]|uniref:ABC transporter substrate-binding protein n=1 Tax=Asanoa iriomotensis TaxID=234613 RepID=A0ABQ4BYY7_9ACTN|nr:extracellular solute-binding protein [Asanoa iriomotensis]GIF55737.1 ABC transporter substrate-binding protein [Asanoa iriomotensis]